MDFSATSNFVSDRCKSCGANERKNAETGASLVQSRGRPARSYRESSGSLDEILPYRERPRFGTLKEGSSAAIAN